MFHFFAFDENRYSTLPRWMRLRSNSKEARSRDAANKDANDEFAHPTAIVSKLKEMMALVAKISDEVTPNEITEWQMMAV